MSVAIDISVLMSSAMAIRFVWSSDVCRHRHFCAYNAGRHNIPCTVSLLQTWLRFVMQLLLNGGRHILHWFSNGDRHCFRNGRRSV